MSDATADVEAFFLPDEICHAFPHFNTVGILRLLPEKMTAKDLGDGQLLEATGFEEHVIFHGHPDNLHG